MQVSLRLMDALSRCSEEDIATLAALLDTLHFSKLFRFPLPNAEHITRLVEEARHRCLQMPQQERLRFLFDEVARRLNLLDPYDDEEWSKELLWKAAEKYGLAKEQPPLTLAREILQRGMLEIVRNYLDAYEKADEQKRQQMQRQLQEALRKTPSQMVDELRRVHCVENMTSDALIGLMRQVVASGGALFFINSLGFSAYIALSTIIHTVFTTMLGVTLPFAVYTTASTVLSVLTGPVGWAILGMIFASMVMFQGKKVNTELLHIVALTALMQWYQCLPQQQDAQASQAIMLAPAQEKLPDVLREGTAELKRLTGSLHDAETKVADFERQIHVSLEKARWQEELTLKATRVANEQQGRVQNLQQQLQLASKRRDDLHSRLQQVPAEHLLLRQRIHIAEEEIRRLQKDLRAAMELAEEAEKQRIAAEQSLQQVLEQAQKELATLQAQKAQIEVERDMLARQVAEQKAKRKLQYQHRFHKLLPYVHLHDRALEWFASQTDENLLLAAERMLLDMNYSVYPPKGWRRVQDTRFEETHFAKDYRIYFAVEGNTKTVMTIGHKNTQIQDIAWLKGQRLC
ncbi:MAG: hypothetical protein KatS3mg022_0157 [Armatimonadota bacterium]|nr:MAG: hypothetical protein KatS3mg022_0157 [Armatimonadota bacterium]